MLYDLLIFLAGIWLKFVNRIEIKGIEKIPACGKLIVACNHRSNADPPVVGVCLAKKRHARFIAKRELFEIPVLNWILRNIGCIPVDRHKAGGDLRALRTSLNALNDGQCVVVFPEGTRAKGGKQPDIKAGAGFLAAKSGAPVLTVRLFRMDKFPFSRKVVFNTGKMLNFSNDCGNPKQAYKDFSDKIMSEIFSITEENAS